MKFIIPGKLPGLNEMTQANRSNIYVGAKLKKDTERMIMDAIRVQGLKPVHEPVYLRFMWVEPNKRRDKDNIVAGGTKVCLDSLVKSGILENDGWKNVIGFSHRFSVDPKNPHVEVEILTEDEVNRRQEKFIEDLCLSMRGCCKMDAVTIFDVAKYILNQMGKVSTWKLQKLCFYAQAWQWLE